MDIKSKQEKFLHYLNQTPSHKQEFVVRSIRKTIAHSIKSNNLRDAYFYAQAFISSDLPKQQDDYVCLFSMGMLMKSKNIIRDNMDDFLRVFKKDFDRLMICLQVCAEDGQEEKLVNAVKFLSTHEDFDQKEITRFILHFADYDQMFLNMCKAIPYGMMIDNIICKLAMAEAHLGLNDYDQALENYRKADQMYETKMNNNSLDTMEYEAYLQFKRQYGRDLGVGRLQTLVLHGRQADYYECIPSLN